MLMTLREVYDTCRDWEKFCRETGLSVWSINEGGEDVQVSLTVKQAQDLGILHKNKE